MERYDVIVIGAGPAGIFAALELLEAGLRVVLVEKGRPIDKRHCPADQRNCKACKRCDIMSGWGGAGAFSDGKLTLTGEVGGWLGQYVPQGELDGLLLDADRVWLRFGADTATYGPDAATAKRLMADARRAGMQLVPMTIRHLGTDRSPEVLGAMYDYLLEAGAGILLNTEATAIVSQDERVKGVELADGRLLSADYVIAAPGREGAEWLTDQAARLGLVLSSNQVDIGVRVECPAAIMEPLTRALYEAKLLYDSPTFNDKVRTFCMNPYGEVTIESYGDVVTVNGHSYSQARTPYTNFAVLVSQHFTEPFHEPITYGRSIARLANLLGEGILVQRLADLRAGRRSTPGRIAESGIEPTLAGATPGDLASVLPYRTLTDIVEFLDAMDALAPGIADGTTLLYGVEVKFYSSCVRVDADLETPISGLYAIGDGAGITRGLLQSSASGMVAARSIVRRTAAS